MLRYYDTSIGRFTRSDFFEGFQEDPVSLHKYFYASGNPVNGTDPSGLFDLGDTTLMVALIGALAAVTYTAYKLSTTHQNIGIVPDYLKGKGNEAVDRLASATLGIDQIQGLEIMRTRIENCNSREPQEECDFGVFPVIVWGNDLTEIRDHTQEALSNLYPSFLRRINPPWSRDKTQEDENELVRLYGQNSSQLESNGFRPPLSWYNVPTTSPSYWNPFVSQPLLINKQCDEYPYASTLQGGRENYYRGGVDLALVSATQNTTQGIWLNNFYRANRITGTSLFLTSDWFGVSTTNRDRSYWYQEGEPTRHYF